MARAILRPPSDCGAESSIRARTRERCCRACRRRPAPRYGADCARISRRRNGRRRMTIGPRWQRAHSRSEVLFLLDQAHPLAAAAGRRLHHDRKPDLVGERADLVFGFQRTGRPRNHRHAGRSHQLARLDLVAHAIDRVGRRSDKHHARLATARAKPAFSEKKPYPGWIASAPVCCAASRIRSDVEIALRGRRGADRHRVIGLAHVQRSRDRRRNKPPPFRSPSSRQARITRTAISPRLAINILLNIFVSHMRRLLSRLASHSGMLPCFARRILFALVLAAP